MPRGPNGQLPTPNPQLPSTPRDLGLGIWDLEFGIWDLGVGRWELAVWELAALTVLGVILRSTVKTLDRYVIREILPPMILSLLIFTFILEIPPVMDQLEQLVAKGVPWGTAARI